MIRRSFLAHALTAATLATAVSVGTASTAQAKPEDPARDVLRAGDGWGSAGSGTTGGADAADHMVSTVTTKAELLAALEGAGGAPAIIRVRGYININYVHNGQHHTPDTYIASVS